MTKIWGEGDWEQDKNRRNACKVCMTFEKSWLTISKQIGLLLRYFLSLLMSLFNGFGFLVKTNIM